MSRRALVLTIIIVFCAVSVAMIIYALIPRATLLMSVAPDQVKVTINGGTHQVNTGDSLTVAPGDLTVTISHDGFDTYTKKLTIKNGQTVEILEALNPQNDAARALLQSQKSQAIIQRITGNSMKQATDTLSNNYPILSILPLNEKYFTATSCPSKNEPNNPEKIAVCIYLYNLEAKQSAIDYIKSKGYDLNNYETYFIDSSYNPDAPTGD